MTMRDPNKQETVPSYHERELLTQARPQTRLATYLECSNHPAGRGGRDFLQASPSVGLVVSSLVFLLHLSALCCEHTLDRCT